MRRSSESSPIPEFVLMPEDGRLICAAAAVSACCRGTSPNDGDLGCGALRTGCMIDPARIFPQETTAMELTIERGDRRGDR